MQECRTLSALIRIVSGPPFVVMWWSLLAVEAFLDEGEARSMSRRCRSSVDCELATPAIPSRSHPRSRSVAVSGHSVAETCKDGLKLLCCWPNISMHDKWKKKLLHRTDVRPSATSTKESRMKSRHIPVSGWQGWCCGQPSLTSAASE